MPGAIALVATVDGAMAGFVAYELNRETLRGVVDLLAVHPDYQNRGIGTELNRFVVERMRQAGMRIAIVGTGGDPGHAPELTALITDGETGPILRSIYQLPDRHWWNRVPGVTLLGDAAHLTVPGGVSAPYGLVNLFNGTDEPDTERLQ